MSSLYKRILGPQYEKLPVVVQELHNYEGSSIYRGECRVERGTNMISNLCATILSLPKAGEAVPVEVKFKQEGEKEHWQRSFDGQPFRSLQWQKNNLLYERLNLTTLVFKVIATPEKLSLELQDVRILGVSMLSILHPKVIAQESEVNGKFQFTIHTTLPLTGLLVAYKGTLERVS